MPRRWTAPGLAAALALPLAWWASSCVLDGFERIGPSSGDGMTVPPAPDASADAPVPCAHATYPELPQEQDGDGDIDFVVAVRSVDFGETTPTAERRIGLDLDTECTCAEGGKRTCQPQRGDAEHCDGPDGRDIASADLFRSLRLSFPDLTSLAYSRSIEEGDWSLLYRVRHYNGMPNDRKVTLDWYIATSFNEQNTSAPVWDGEDEWPISSAGLTSPTGGPYDPGGSYDGRAYPLYTSKSAYVSGWMLAAPFQDIEVNLAGRMNAVFKIRLSGATLVARIEKQGVRYALRDGVIAGRWPEAEIFNMLSSYRRGDGEPLCTDDLYYEGGRITFCKALDINEVEGAASRPCDALSIGIGFEAFPARLGDIYPPALASPGCPPETDPRNDTCSGDMN